MSTAAWAETCTEAALIAGEKSPKKVSVEVSPKKSRLDSATHSSLSSKIHIS